MKVLRAIKKRTKLIVIDPRETYLAQRADLWLPVRPGTNIALLAGMLYVIFKEELYEPEFIRDYTENFETLKREILREWTVDRVERVTGVSKGDIEKAARLYARAERALILYGLGVAEHRGGTYGVMMLANLALSCGHIGRPGAGIMPLRGQNNVQGVCDVGALPYTLPGYRKFTEEEIAEFERVWGVRLPREPGLMEPQMYEEALAGRFKGLYVIGYDPAQTHANISKVREALKKLELLVVQELFFTETAGFAHVVLPAASLYEKEGTVTNGERRIMQVNRAVPPRLGTKPDWEIICEVSRRLGYEMNYKNPREILDEMREVMPIYAGARWDRLEGSEICWPVLDEEHPGTKILYQKGFPRGKAKFEVPKWLLAEENADKDYPFVLITGRRLYHYNCGAMTARCEGFLEVMPEERIDINPRDAQALGIRDGDMVKVISRRGEVRVKARVTSQVQQGQVFMAFHFRETLTNLVTSAALDEKTLTPEYKVAAVRIELA
jgi:predicted molibdopterin-dependent oxidoreductase YjgC